MLAPLALSGNHYYKKNSRIWNRRESEADSYRSVLALYTGAVKSHGWDALDFALDAEHAFVVLLARLGLRKVSCSQRDWSDDTCWNQDITAVQDLGATLKTREKLKWSHLIINTPDVILHWGALNSDSFAFIRRVFLKGTITSTLLDWEQWVWLIQKELAFTQTQTHRARCATREKEAVRGKKQNKTRG